MKCVWLGNNKKKHDICAWKLRKSLQPICLCQIISIYDIPSRAKGHLEGGLNIYTWRLWMATQSATNQDKEVPVLEEPLLWNAVLLI